jgi:hypothetical protein
MNSISKEHKNITISDLGKTGIKRNYFISYFKEDTIKKSTKRFNDFKEFHKYLVGKYPFEIIPVLPEKNFKKKIKSIFQISNQTIEYNRIEKLLELLLNHLINESQNEDLCREVENFIEDKVFFTLSRYLAMIIKLQRIVSLNSSFTMINCKINLKESSMIFILNL